MLLPHICLPLLENILTAWSRSSFHSSPLLPYFTFPHLLFFLFFSLLSSLWLTGFSLSFNCLCEADVNGHNHVCYFKIKLVCNGCSTFLPYIRIRSKLTSDFCDYWEAVWVWGGFLARWLWSVAGLQEDAVWKPLCFTWNILLKELFSYLWWGSMWGIWTFIYCICMMWDREGGGHWLY